MGFLTPPFCSFNKINKISFTTDSTKKRSSRQIENKEHNTATILAEQKRIKTSKLRGKKGTGLTGAYGETGWIQTTKEEKIAIGIYDVIMAPTYDAKYYISHNPTYAVVGDNVVQSIEKAGDHEFEDKHATEKE